MGLLDLINSLMLTYPLTNVHLIAEGEGEKGKRRKRLPELYQHR